MFILTIYFSLFISLLHCSCVAFFIFETDSLHAHMQTKQHLHKHNVASGMLTRSLSKRARNSSKLSRTEFWLLLPFMLMVVLPITSIALFFYMFGIMFENLIWYVQN